MSNQIHIYHKVAHKKTGEACFTCFANYCFPKEKRLNDPVHPRPLGRLLPLFLFQVILPEPNRLRGHFN